MSSMQDISTYFQSERAGLNQANGITDRLEIMENCMKDIQTSIKEIRSDCIHRIEVLEETVSGKVVEDNRKDTFLKHLRRFASTSSLHGVPNIASASQFWMRIFWSTALTGKLSRWV